MHQDSSRIGHQTSMKPGPTETGTGMQIVRIREHQQAGITAAAEIDTDIITVPRTLEIPGSTSAPVGMQVMHMKQGGTEAGAAATVGTEGLADMKGIRNASKLTCSRSGTAIISTERTDLQLQLSGLAVIMQQRTSMTTRLTGHMQATGMSIKHMMNSRGAAAVAVMAWSWQLIDTLHGVLTCSS